MASRDDTDKTAAGGLKTEREARLTVQLRANLKKRKALAKARAAKKGIDGRRPGPAKDESAP